MKYVSSRAEQDQGFALWLEADMIPVKSNWIELLEEIKKNN